MNTLENENSYVNLISDLFINAVKENFLTNTNYPYTSEHMLKNLPINAENERLYTGINQILLMNKNDLKNYKDPRWLTKKQIIAEGGKIKNNEEGVRLRFCENFSDFETVTVFNVKQVQFSPEHKYSQPFRDRIFAKDLWQNFENAEKFLRNVDVKIYHDKEIKYASFSSKYNAIFSPDRYLYRNQESYYSTIFHEVSHWAGSASCLNRQEQKVILSSFDSNEKEKCRNREELIAEISSFM